MKSLGKKCVPKFSIKTVLGKLVWSVPINIIFIMHCSTICSIHSDRMIKYKNNKHMKDYVSLNGDKIIFMFKIDIKCSFIPKILCF